MSRPLIIRFPRGTIICDWPNLNEDNSNKPKYMKTILTDQEVKDMFSCANRNTQVMLRELFGDEQLGLKGNGVWCLDSEGNLVDRKEWDKHSMTPHGAVVITK